MIRLNKFLSEIGFCSRREADQYIQQGKVVINDHVAVMGEKVEGNERITVNGRAVFRQNQDHVYIAFNKPRGIVCTTKNDKDNIIDYIKFPRRIFLVGRLDKDSDGLILLTSDGSIVNRMMRAAYGHEKEYRVTVDRPLTDDFMHQMSSGVYLSELEVTSRPCTVKKMSARQFSIILTQGLNRQIRRMCQMLGYRVVRLQRIRVMNIKLGDLSLGQWRYLTDRELSLLHQQIIDLAQFTIKESRDADEY